jgi:hypothetical protein
LAKFLLNAVSVVVAKLKTAKDKSLVVELGNEMANSGSLRGHFMVADEFQPDIEVRTSKCVS